MNPYLEQKILNADPLELIRILYQHGIMSVRKAREHLRAGHIAERAKEINRAYRIIAELNSALRPEQAPDLARNLRRLYEYMQRRLIEANFQQTDEPLAEVLGLLSTLSAAWSSSAAPQVAPEAPRLMPHAASAWQAAAFAPRAAVATIEVAG